MGTAVEIEAKGVGPILVQFKAGDTVSAEIDLEGMLLAGIWIPAGFTGTTITFQAAERPQGTFQAVFDQNGNAVTLTVAAGRTVVMNPAGVPGATGGTIGFLRYIKLVVSAQGAAATLFLLRKQGAG